MLGCAIVRNGAALDPRICDRARIARDPRFDGAFYTGVKTTRIYCRPTCPVKPAKSTNVVFFPTAAAAERAGFRPCLRCRPETAPGTPAWRGAAATVSRALRLIERGFLDGEARVGDLADTLGMTARHLRRLFLRHAGASPTAVATTRRVQRAKALVDGTTLSMSTIAFASGFASIRRFNAAFRAVYRRSPTAVRRARAARPRRRCRAPSPVALFRREEPTMAKGTLIAAMSIGQAAEDEFQDWYDTEHLPERQRVPGFLVCHRWIGATDRKISVATYDLDNVKVLASPAYLAIGGANLSPWSKRVTSKVERLMRFEGDQILPGDQLPPANAGGLLLNAMNIAPEHEAEFNEWYDKEHIPALAAVPGVLCARRFRGTGNRKYVALYHLATPEVQDSAEWKQARQSDWTSRLQAHFRDHLRLVLRRYVRGA